MCASCFAAASSPLEWWLQDSGDVSNPALTDATPEGHAIAMSEPATASKVPQVDRLYSCLIPVLVSAAVCAFVCPFSPPSLFFTTCDVLLFYAVGLRNTGPPINPLPLP